MDLFHPIIGANWKMNKTLAESISTACSLVNLLDRLDDRTVFINVPYTCLLAVKDIFHQAGILVGAQNVFWEDWGAYTGEISASMLKDLGIDIAMVGHSERRTLFSETDMIINQKLRALLRNGLLPVLCIGEPLDVRVSKCTEAYLTNQLIQDLEGVQRKDFEHLIIAYEPIWAIGSGLSLDPTDAEETHTFIRKKVTDLLGEQIEKHIHIIYGGSINTTNAAELAKMSNVDGLYVGGASLNAYTFAQIVYWDKPAFSQVRRISQNN